mmetsp:Transcript_16146/g.22543  ORF Transcript_16146/g.22543 Transcript_16146/m.22543 type:complete len:656 (-) Transcript_16146:393-2360(-)
MVRLKPIRYRLYLLTTISLVSWAVLWATISHPTARGQGLASTLQRLRGERDKAAKPNQRINAPPPRTDILQTMIRAAKAGDSSAQVQMAKTYQKGLHGIKPNPEEAFKWYKAAAVASNKEALREVSSCLFQGIGIRKNATQAVQWLRAAARRGEVQAMTQLALMIQNKSVVAEGGPWECQMLLAHAAEAGFAMAMREYGKLRLEGGFVDEGISWLLKAATRDDPPACMEIARAYQLGLGVPMDPQRAVRYYTAAANKGIEAAVVALGDMFHHGHAGGAVGVDLRQAIYWYTRAAEEHQHTESMFRLGGFYERGRELEGSPVERDLGKANMYYTRAAQLRSSDAQEALARLHTKAIFESKQPHRQLVLRSTRSMHVCGEIYGIPWPLRVLLDTGSDCDLISKECAERLMFSNKHQTPPPLQLNPAARSRSVVPGLRVRLKGLKKTRELNDMAGTVVGAGRGSPQRYPVVLDSSSRIVTVKESNMEYDLKNPNPLATIVCRHPERHRESGEDCWIAASSSAHPHRRLRRGDDGGGGAADFCHVVYPPGPRSGNVWLVDNNRIRCFSGSPPSSSKDGVRIGTAIEAKLSIGPEDRFRLLRVYPEKRDRVGWDILLGTDGIADFNLRLELHKNASFVNALPAGPRGRRHWVLRPLQRNT